MTTELLQLVTITCLYTLRTYLVFHFLPLIKNYLGHSAIIATALGLAIFTVFSYPQPENCKFLFNLQFFFATTLQILPLAITIYTFSHCGRICDTLRGAHQAELIYSGVDQRQSPLEQLFQMLVICLALSHGGYLLIINPLIEPALIDGYRDLTPGYIEIIFKLSAHSLSKGLSLAFPVLAFCAIFEIFAAFIERILKNSGIGNELIAVKMLLVIMIIALTLYNGDVLFDAQQYLSNVRRVL